jgi:hypothetical protein
MLTHRGGNAGKRGGNGKRGSKRELTLSRRRARPGERGQAGAAASKHGSVMKHKVRSTMESNVPESKYGFIFSCANLRGTYLRHHLFWMPLEYISCELTLDEFTVLGC